MQSSVATVKTKWRRALMLCSCALSEPSCLPAISAGKLSVSGRSVAHARVLRQRPPPDSRSLETLSQSEATQGCLVRVLRLAVEGSATNQSEKGMNYQDCQGVSVC